METFIMSIKEMNQLPIIEHTKNKQITQEKAARILNITIRQIRRKVRNYKQFGPTSVIHKNRNKKGNRALKPNVEELIITLANTTYNGFGPTLIAEKLALNHNIFVDHETVRRKLIKHGLWKVKKKVIKKHVWRERKKHVGEMIQVDGSFHRWFGHEKSTLIAFIDDATGYIPVAKFVDYETTENLAMLTKEYVTKYGRPVSLYTDRGRTYKVNNAKDGKIHKTRYEKMLQELDIQLIHAYSPQAKGRVERLFKTLQDRLVKELKLAKISDIDRANQFLNEIYLPFHNKKFVCKPTESANLHRTMSGYDLNYIFCIKDMRIINNDYTVCFKNIWFQLKTEQPIFIRRGKKVVIHSYFDGTHKISYNRTYLNFKYINKNNDKH